MAEEKKSIVLRVTPELHQKLKEYTVRNKMTLQQYLIQLVEKDQAQNNREG